MSGLRAPGMLVLAVLVTACGDGQTPASYSAEALQAAVEVEGAEFSTRRNEFLATVRGDVGPLLQVLVDDPAASWRERFAAYVLQGWASPETDYQTLLEADRITDRKGLPRYAWAVERPPALDGAVPLLLEFLVLGTAEPGGRDDALSALPALARRGATIPETLLLEGTLPTSGLTLEERRLIAWALASLPRPLPPAEVEAALMAQLQQAPDRFLVRYLLDVLAPAAREGWSEPDRDQLMGRLGSQTVLEKLVDEEYYVQRLGRIGGPMATRRVLGYIQDNQTPETNRWGLDLAGGLSFSNDLRAYLKLGLLAEGPAFFSPETTRLRALEAVGSLADRYAGEDRFAENVRTQLGALLGEVADPLQSDPRTRPRFEELQGRLSD